MNNAQNTTPIIGISSEVFAHFPEYRRGLLIAEGLKNGPSPASLVEQIRAAEQRLRTELAGQDVNLIPQLERWREAFRISGIKPTKFRPSIDALARRVLSGNDLPSINLLVDIGNLVSLRYLIPVGAHAIDEIKSGMFLRPALGNEDFYPFGAEPQSEPEHPEPGEIIFTDGNLVMTRRWAWRQAEHSLVRENTMAVEFNVDLLPPQPAEIHAEIFAVLGELVHEYCGGSSRTAVLDRQTPEVPLFQAL